MKILYVTTVGVTMNFFKSCIKNLIVNDYVVDIATNQYNGKYKVDTYYNSYCSNIINLSLTRSPLNVYKNIKSIIKLKRIIKMNNYDIVHCHTPIASMCTRIACRNLRKNGLKVVYTAHGFHFYKGAPLLNWVVYYPIEKICSYWTDVLITINKDDYEFAKNRMKAKKIEYVPGVGVDIDTINEINIDIEEKKKSIGVPKDSFVVLSVGELNKNKNHQLVIDALSLIHSKNIYYLIAGSGDDATNLIELAREKNVNLILLGQRKDVFELYQLADLYVHPSYREGLPVSLMEAIASKRMVICSNIRGNKDLVQKDCLFEIDKNKLKNKIVNCMNSDCNEIIKRNYENMNKFSIDKVNKKMIEIYENLITI